VSLKVKDQPMQQFRPLPWYLQEDDSADVDISISGHQSGELPLHSPASTAIETQTQTAPTMPLLLLESSELHERHTGDLAPISGPLSPEPGGPAALSLMAALKSTMSVNPRERVMIIPAEKKRERTTDKLTLPRRRMSLRLRHGLVATVVLLVMVTTLLSLTPLASGQDGFQIFSAFGHWVSQQAMDWAITSHAAPKPQQATLSNNNPVPPPMSLPTSQYVAIAQQDAINAGISPVYFARQINQESGFNPNAYSPAGAEGIAQFEPGTAASMGIDPWNPIQALQAAAQLMASYNRYYNGNYAMALAAYNGGTGTVTYAVNTCGAANWLNCLPWETRNYIYVIMGI
jgi:hypothetical protein